MWRLHAFLNYSYYLWSISHPGKNGVPTLDLSGNVSEVSSVPIEFTAAQKALERVIMVTFKHYEIPLEISDQIRAAFKSKLW